MPISLGDISWNFEKFLIGKNGQPLVRFAPRTTPSDPALVAATSSGKNSIVGA